MYKSLKIFALLSSLSFSYLGVSAQSDSPYSRYGLGTLNNHTPGSLKGMGGIGIGVSKTSGINSLNPASYAQVDSLTFILDIGVNYNHTRYKDDLGSYGKDGGGLDYVAVLFPVSKRVAISGGLIPFSTTRYTISNEAKLDGKDADYTVVNSSSGGLSQVYLGMAYELPFLEGLSVGFNASYLFGNLNYGYQVYSISESSSAISSYYPYQYSTLNVTTAKVDLGLQYTLNMSDRRYLTLGLTYSPKINGTGSLKVETYNGEGTGETESTSKVVDTGTPNMFGFGVSYGKFDQWLVGADFGYEQWKDARFTNDLGDGMTDKQRFNNRIRVAVGGEYRVAEYSRKYFEKMKFRLGVNYNNSYVNVLDKNNDPKGYKQYGVTVGFGFPLTDRMAIGSRTSYLNLNFEYKKLKPELKSMLSEDYFGVSLSMNINELWFRKPKIQ